MSGGGFREREASTNLWSPGSGGQHAIQICGRITLLMGNGKMASDLGLPPVDAAHDRVMICGSPALLKDLKALLEARHFKEGNTSTPGEYVIERAFVEQ